MICLTLPWPPSTNHYWRHNQGRTHISAEGKAFRQIVQWRALEARTKCLSGRLSVAVEAFPPDKRRRDLDNVLKALLDALQHAGCYEDDSQIDQLIVRRRYQKKGGFVLVKVEDLGT